MEGSEPGTGLAHGPRGVLSAVLEGLPEEPLVNAAGIRELRASLRDRLAEVTRSTPVDVAPNASAAVDGEAEELVVNRYAMRRALACPASATEPDEEPFAWTAPNAARTLGLATLSWVTRTGADVAAGVATAIDERVSEPNDSLGEWLAAQPDPARGAVVGAASSWAARALVAVPWQQLGRVQYLHDSVWQRLGGDPQVILRARPDALVAVPVGKIIERVTLLLGRVDQPAARLDCLVISLRARRAPLRAVIVDPASGELGTWDVDAALLEAAANDVVATAAALQACRQGLAAEVPGPQCTSCHRLARCATGSTHVGGRRPRIGGIPI
jgi:hypothetical protein